MACGNHMCIVFFNDRPGFVVHKLQTLNSYSDNIYQHHFLLSFVFSVKLPAIYFTVNNPQKIIDGSIPIIFPHKEPQKEWAVTFWTFLRTWTGRWTQQNHTTAHDIPIEQLLPLNNLLWIILITCWNRHVITFSIADQRLHG